MGDATVIGRRRLAKTTLSGTHCRQALRGAQGHPQSGGGLEPALYYLSLSTEAKQALSWRPLYRDVTTLSYLSQIFGSSNTVCVQ